MAALQSAFAAGSPDRITEALSALLGSSDVIGGEFDTYWHPLGFFRIELGRHQVSERGRFALHFWPAGQRSTQQPEFAVHRHVHHITSCVLHGKLVDTNYRAVDTDSADVSGPLYKIATGHGYSDMTRLPETISLSRRAVEAQTPGTCYVPAPGESFHSTDVGIGTAAITVVHIGHQTRPYPDVIGEFGLEPHYHYERVRVPAPVISGCVDTLRDVLKDS
jgi:hypothetical protein